MLTKDQTAKMLAGEHFRVDEDVEAVYRLTSSAEDDPQEPIKLLLVSAGDDGSGQMPLLPLHFNAHPPSGLFYDYELLVVTPQEWDRVQRGDLALPEGWSLGRRMARQESEKREPAKVAA